MGNIFARYLFHYYSQNATLRLRYANFKGLAIHCDYRYEKTNYAIKFSIFESTQNREIEIFEKIMFPRGLERSSGKFA